MIAWLLDFWARRQDDIIAKLAIAALFLVLQPLLKLFWRAIRWLAKRLGRLGTLVVQKLDALAERKRLSVYDACDHPLLGLALVGRCLASMILCTAAAGALVVIGMSPATVNTAKGQWLGLVAMTLALSLWLRVMSKADTIRYFATTSWTMMKTAVTQAEDGRGYKNVFHLRGPSP